MEPTQSSSHGEGSTSRAQTTRSSGRPTPPMFSPIPISSLGAVEGLSRSISPEFFMDQVNAGGEQYNERRASRKTRKRTSSLNRLSEIAKLPVEAIWQRSAQERSTVPHSPRNPLSPRAILSPRHPLAEGIPTSPRSCFEVSATPLNSPKSPDHPTTDQ